MSPACDALLPVRIGGNVTRALLRTAAFVVDPRHRPRFEARAVPAPARSLVTAVHAGLDEVILAGFKTLRRMPDTEDLARIDAEGAKAVAFFEAHGWLDDPASYHEDPPPLTDPELGRRRILRTAYETLSFESGYEPHPGEPGRKRWLSYQANRRVPVLVLRHVGDEPRPWLVCVHGAEMARPAIDTRFFRAEYLHRVLGLNVALPVLPLHGARRRNTGAEFPTIDVCDNVHGLAQAAWDVRRVISWVRSQDPLSIGVMGFSLGGYTTALVAGLESDLDCVIAGGPATDFPTLFRASVPRSLRNDRRFQSVLDRIDVLHRVVSPLAIVPKATRDRLFIFAGLADRLTHPIEQVADLWDHWGKPEVLWHRGGHLGHQWVAEVARFIDGTIHDRLLTVASDDVA